MQNSHVNQIASILDKNHNFILTTHLNPDGDGIGSQVAFYHYLKKRGKNVTILNVDTIPKSLKFLENGCAITLFDENRHRSLVQNADIILILDISDWKRLQRLGDIVRESNVETVCIDHHLLEQQFSDHDFVFPVASSTGELIYDLFTGLHADFSKEICDGILTAVMSDTGCFRFTNTSPKVFEIAAEMQRLGADRKMIYSELYENQDMPRIRLLARVLNNLHLDCGGKIAWMEVNQKMLKETGAILKDTEGLADFPRRIQDVEISILFMELPDNKVKISFRSRGIVAINNLAGRFGGGGHAFASGASVEGNLSSVIEDVLFQAHHLFE
ncbi:bifunctional oligoribonuclease/PAP phosphatase NrnA [candidate division KSB1 bacterium]|nr:bifunctional oligoribonuclease/PAP phosphatase NrnA [candidate division KSB1 bacterium]